MTNRSPSPDRDPAPRRDLAWRLAVRLVNGGSRTGMSELRRAVAGRTVLVTGASYGIGEAAALRLGRAGARVLLVARTKDRLEEVAAAIRGAGGQAAALACDLSDLDAVGELAEQVVAEYGGVDVLVNNAGKSIRRSIALSMDRFHDFERTATLNYLSPVRLTLGLLPAMRARGHGHVVNVLTVASRTPPAPFWSAYQASKSALDVWSRAARAEFADDGIDFTMVHMGLVHTRMSAPTPEYRDQPGLSPAQAGAMVCDAIARRPRSVGPSWLWPVEAFSAAFPAVVDRQMRRVARTGKDTASSIAAARSAAEELELRQETEA